MQQKPTVAELVIMIAGAVALVFSFLNWVDFGGFGGGASAWDSNLFFPTFAWVGIFGAAMAIVIALEVFANVNLPQRLHSFTWPQVHLVLGVFAALLAISFLIGKPSGPDYGFGFFLSLVGAIGLIVGAVMLDRERPDGVRPVAQGGAGGASGPTPPPPPPPG